MREKGFDRTARASVNRGRKGRIHVLTVSELTAAVTEHKGDSTNENLGVQFDCSTIRHEQINHFRRLRVEERC